MQEGIYGIQTTPLVTYFLLFPASLRAYTTAACSPHPGELRVEIKLARNIRLWD